MIVTKENFDETRYRAKLDKQFNNGGYQIGEAPFVLWTGKGGKIDFEVAFIKAILEQGCTFNKEILYGK